MADSIVRVLEQAKLITRNCEKWRGAVLLKKDPDETIDLEVDWTAWLDGDTIDQTNYELSGGVAVSQALASPLVTLTISGDPGVIYHRITTTTSAETKELKIAVEDPSGVSLIARDYC